tara:strand:- start:282 stop:536 length:255 start_codon:yes stop_codon:yes gene_type:complete
MSGLKTQQDWKELLPLVNSELYPLLQRYVNWRIETLRNQLENTKGEDNFALVQGKIMEARLCAVLKESVLQNTREHSNPYEHKR